MLRPRLRNDGFLSTVPAFLFVLTVIALGITGGLWGSKALAQQITVDVPQLPRSLDPHSAAYFAESSPLPNMFETLLKRDQDGKLSAGLAEAFEGDQAGVKWDIKLRRNVKFQDGSPLTARDVAFSIKRFLKGINRDPGQRFPENAIKVTSPPPADAWRGIEVDEIEVVDDFRVRLHLRKGAQNLRSLIGGNIAIASRKHFESPGNLPKPMGSGPYRSQELKVGQFYDMVPFTEYWGGAPKGCLRIREVPDQAARVAALLTGQSDIAAGLDNTGAGLGAIQSNQKTGLKVAPVLPPRTRTVMLSLNIRSGGQASDLPLRQAVASTLDRARLIRDAGMGGFASEAHTLLPTILDPSRTPDPVSSQTGSQSSPKFNLDTEIYAPTELREIAQGVARQLQTIGIRAGVRLQEREQLRQRALDRTAKGFTLFAVSPTVLEPHAYLASLESGGAARQDSPAFDELLKRGSVNFTASLYQEITQHVRREVPVIPLVRLPASSYAIDPTRTKWRARADTRILGTEVSVSGSTSCGGSLYAGLGGGGDSVRVDYVKALEAGLIDPRVQSGLAGPSSDETLKIMQKIISEQWVRSRPRPPRSEDDDKLTLGGTSVAGPPPALGSTLADGTRIASSSADLRFPDEVRYDSATKRLKIPFYPLGFSEVGVISQGGLANCTGTRVHREWVITAKHCVPDAAAASNHAFFLAAASGSDELRVGSANAPQILTGYRRYPVKLALHYATKPGEAPRDIALLAIEPGADSNAKVAEILQTVPEGNIEVTMAGWGYTGDPADVTGKSLEIGWQKARPRDTTRLWWLGMGTRSDTCPGDSGGPIFSGTRFGYAGEDHGLIAVVSAGVSRIGRFGCERAGDTTVTLVSTPPVLGWMCGATGGGLAYCKGRK